MLYAPYVLKTALNKSSIFMSDSQLYPLEIYRFNKSIGVILFSVKVDKAIAVAVKGAPYLFIYFLSNEHDNDLVPIALSF